MSYRYASAIMTAALGMAAACGSSEPPTEPEVPSQSDVISGSWGFVADLPEPLGLTGAVGHSGRLYVVGGGRRDISQSSSRAYRYDPSTDEWERLPDLPVSVFRPAAFVHDGTVLVAGGSVALNDISARDEVFAWDESSGTWVIHSRLPEPSNAPTGASASGHAMALQVGHGPVPSNPVAWLPPSATEWVSLPPVPLFARHAVGGDGQLWGVGEGAIIPFSLEDGSWGPRVDSPYASQFGWTIGAWGYDDRVHLLMRLSFPEHVHTVWDSRERRWFSAATPPDIDGWGAASAAYLDGRLYLVGGYDSNDALRPFTKVATFRLR